MPCGIILLLIFLLLLKGELLKKRQKGDNSKLLRAEQVFWYRGKLDSVEIVEVHVRNIFFFP